MAVGAGGQQKSDTSVTKGNTEKAWSMSIGVLGSYAWWSPTWGRYPNAVLMNYLMPAYRFTVAPSFLYGPVLALSIGYRWGFSASFIHSRYTGRARVYPTTVSYSFTSAVVLPLTIRRRAEKMDADLLVNFAATRYCKVFFGPKYQGYRYHESYITQATVIYHSLSLGSGLIAGIPVVSRLTLQPSLSAFALYGWEKRRGGGFGTGGSSRFDRAAQRGYAWALGVNGSLALAYAVPAARLAFTVGYKAQYIHYFRSANPLHGQRYDLFHGASASVVVTF